MFFQSFAYLEQVLKYLKDKGIFQQIIDCKKVIFYEERSVADTFEKYSKTGGGSGNFLLCVINGRLSEGINFTDDLARLLMVIGLPYAGRSVEIEERRAFWDREGHQSFKGNHYYQGLCMKAVNQAIGRAIRHKDDSSMIWLIDQRFKTVSNDLP